MKQKKYNHGEVIFRQGETGNCMYSICRGRLAVYADYDTDNARKLAELKDGDFFGEMGLIENEPRSATVIAMTDDTVLDEISESSFLGYFEENPAKVFMMMKQLSQRLRKTTQDYLEVCHTIYDVSKQDEDLPIDPELNAKLLAIQNEYLMFNMSGLRFY